MAADVAIRGGIVVTPEAVAPADIYVQYGRVVAVQSVGATGLGANREIRADGHHVFPGLIDSHVHFNDPGRDHWEGAATGSRALAAGGGSCFVDMPLNSSPPTLDADAFGRKQAALEVNSITDFALWGGLTPVNLDRMEELAACGVVGFKAFMCPSGIDDFPYADDITLLRGMERAAALKLPVALHAESAGIVAALAAKQRDSDSAAAFCASRPIVAELEAISRALLYARETGCSVHIVHVSNPRGVELIAEARSSGLDVSAETCPHYLTFTTDDAQRIGPRAKCAPPLRDDWVRRGLICKLVDGSIMTVGSDHSPAPSEMKDTASFAAAWGGISGVQTSLRALLSVGLQPRRIAAVMGAAPAERLGLAAKGRIAPGFDADLCIVDTEAQAVVERDELVDKHRQSPYVGRTLRGRVLYTLRRGTVIYDAASGTPTVEPGILQRPNTWLDRS